MFSYMYQGGARGGNHSNLPAATLQVPTPTPTPLPPLNCYTDFVLVKIMKQKPVLEMLPKPFSTFVRLFDFHCSHKLLLKLHVKQNHCSMEYCDGSLKTLSISGCTNMCLGMTYQLKITILHSLNRGDLSNETTPKCKQRW